MKKVLILGAGLVSKPLIEYLLEKRIALLVASPVKERADEMIGVDPLGKSVDWSMDDPLTLSRLISEHDVTVSLLPFRYHTEVAKLCIGSGRPLVTTSYVQPDMMALDGEAREKGVLLLNETGLDPGIDHMSAMKIINEVHDNGGSIEKFFSLCGALPAPEAAGNPFKYKFSWSPTGVILASRNSALYLKDKQKIYIDPEDLFRDRFACNFPGIGELEVYPNRDSISYIDIYGIPEVSTMYRGTFRYRGWCEILDVMKRLNMLDDKVISCKGKSYAEFFAETAGTGTADLSTYIKTKLGIKVDSAPFKALEFLGFFSSEIMNNEEISPMEVTAGRMIELMTLGDNDRDMVAMQHIFLAGYPSGHREVIKSSMLDFGSPSANTAIARTVALPAAIAARLILENKLTLSGVHRPVIPQIYNPLLEELRTLGIEMKEEYGLPESELMIF